MNIINKPKNLNLEIMSISTNSIIHYTNEIAKLKLIVKEGFKIKYCAERLILGRGRSEAAHPMVSFCDIPLSESKKHFKAYGKFGIGLKKEWAIERGVNPVLYIDHNSLFAKSLQRLMAERRKSKTNLTEEQSKDILQIKAYAKNYSGPLKRRGIEDQNYKFYDEREWRIVPKSEEINNVPFSISLSKYEKNKDTFNQRISDCRIKFEAKDISYIIVEHTSQIPEFIKFLRIEYSGKCSVNEFDLLLSKICSTEQILADY